MLILPGQTRWLKKGDTMPLIGRTPEKPPQTIAQDPGRNLQWLRVEEAYCEHYNGTKYWSFAFHFTFGTAAVAGVLATLLSGHTGVQVPWFEGKTLLNHRELVGLLTGAVTLLTAVGGFGAFERKWRANRATATQLWILRNAAEKPNSDVPDIDNKLAQILTLHDAGILGDGGTKTNSGNPIPAPTLAATPTATSTPTPTPTPTPPPTLVPITRST